MILSDPVTGRASMVVDVIQNQLIISSPITGRRIAVADMSNWPAGTAAGATTLILTRPASDLALFPVIEASASADFTDAVVLDAHGSAADRAYCKVFTGSQWIDLPASGLGTPFDGLTVSVDMSVKFAALAQPYYVRFCWRTAAGADSDWESLIFPSVAAASTNIPNHEQE